MGIGSLDIGLIVGYSVLVIALGFWSARKQSPDQYLAHGRNLGLLPFIASVSASWIGGGAIVAYSAYVYEYGIAALSLYLGVLISMLFFAQVAPRLRQMGHQLEHLTLADYFYHQVGKKAGLAIATVLTLVYFLFILNQFIAGSSILSSLSGWSYEMALFVSSVVVLVYLIVGGMKSVVSTDVFQYLSVVLLLLIVGGTMIGKTGVDPVMFDVSNMKPGLFVAFVLYGLFFPFCSAEIWQRIYMTRSDRDAKIGLIASGFFILVMGLCITLIGMAARTMNAGIDPSEAVAYGMLNLLPSGLLGLGLIIIFAAIMSTVDTLIFYLSTSIAKDYFGHLLNRTDKADMRRITRTCVVLVTMLGVVFAYFFRDLVAVIVTLAGIGLGVVPPILLSFFRKVNSGAVRASVYSGCIYVALLVVTDNIEPDLSVLSMVVSAVVLALWQKWGR